MGFAGQVLLRPQGPVARLRRDRSLWTLPDTASGLLADAPQTVQKVGVLIAFFRILAMADVLAHRRAQEFEILG